MTTCWRPSALPGTTWLSFLRDGSIRLRPGPSSRDSPAHSRRPSAHPPWLCSRTRESAGSRRSGYRSWSPWGSSRCSLLRFAARSKSRPPCGFVKTGTPLSTPRSQAARGESAFTVATPFSRRGAPHSRLCALIRQLRAAARRLARRHGQGRLRIGDPVVSLG